MQCDTNGDNVPDSREFAGSHRYNTAVALAERFAADEGSVSTVIIASGESQVDAVTAAGLAGNLNAAVLLTRSNQLPHNVARFIDEHNVTEVIVVGGTAAVPDSIMTAIEGLGSRPSVDRVSGTDRYATAAAIGNKLGGPNPTWCGSTQTAAILVNGGDEGRADAVVAGPLAFRLGLPILLTGADELPEATRAFLTDNKVERVVVIGGMSAVSGDVVEDMIENVGVVNVQRISGGSAAATSVDVAQEMLGNCADVLNTNRDLVALVNREAIADGITAAPVLGRGLGDGGSVPILLVSDDLPAAVSDYLASTTEVRGGQKTHLDILAIGGTAVVSEAVMADAVAAAKTSAALTAEIKVAKNATGTAYETWINDAGTPADTSDDTVGGGVFTVTFSDDVKLPMDGEDSGTIAGDSAAELAGTALDPTLYRLNGRRIEALHAVDPRLAPEPTGTDEELIGYSDLVFTADREVKIYLSHVLEPNAKISVVGGSKIGDNDDQRPLEDAELTLGALASSADRTAPVVEIIAYQGATTFVVYVSEPNILHNELVNSEWDDFISVDGKGTTTVEIDTPSDTFAANERQGVDARLTVTLSDSDVLEVGDTVIVERQAILDKSGRGNSLRRHTVTAHKAQGKFEVSSVSIGDYVHTAQATAEIVAVAPDAGNKLIIGAKKGGIADGAVGNSWVIYGYDDRPDTDSTTDGVQNGNMFNIRVGVDTQNRVISYTISQTSPPTPLPAEKTGPTLEDLAVALVGNDTFNANFSVSYDAPATQRKNSTLGGTDASGEHFGDESADDSETQGMTAVGVVVKFNDIVQFLTATTDGSTSDDGVALAASIGPADGVAGAVNFLAPDNVVHISYTASSMAQLPTRAGFRVIPAGIASSYNADGNGDGTADDIARNVREILNSLRPDSSIKP
ncbi:MAG: cell wall-binding repeat-containing protein [Acidimicrobiaceae bacterium]|nr:cell wall-binding repeat-containing protein [Acidimicrobiaceae bacterium]